MQHQIWQQISSSKTSIRRKERKALTSRHPPRRLPNYRKSTESTYDIRTTEPVAKLTRMLLTMKAHTMPLAYRTILCRPKVVFLRLDKFCRLKLWSNRLARRFLGISTHRTPHRKMKASHQARKLSTVPTLRWLTPSRSTNQTNCRSLNHQPLLTRSRWTLSVMATMTPRQLRKARTLCLMRIWPLLCHHKTTLIRYLARSRLKSLLCMRQKLMCSRRHRWRKLRTNLNASLTLATLTPQSKRRSTWTP